MKRLAILTLALVLSGCAALPTAGPIRIGPDITSGAGLDSFYYSPSSPTSGASQSEILSGFLSAGTGPQNDYGIAREYLSEALRATWNPNQEVLIQRGSPSITITEDDRALIEFDLVARIDSDGRYESLPVGSSRLLEFSFVREGDQWRISSAPDNTVLIRPVFDVIFRSYAIYFLDRQQRFLVPELRWFPATPATGTRLVNALLRGPSGYLKPAVQSAIPSGTRLSIDAVTVENNTALVDLTARALVANRLDRSLMKTQLAATLSQLPNVQQVAISIERSRQEIPDNTSATRADEFGSLLSLTEDGLEAASELEVIDATGFLESVSASEIALDRQSGRLVALGSGGLYRTSLANPGADVELLDSRSNLLAPVFDRQQYLWSVSRNRDAALLAIPAAGERALVSANWLSRDSIRGFDIAAEGTRIVILLQGTERNRVLISSIIRDRSGVPISLAEPQEIAHEVPFPKAVSFVDGQTIAVISEAADISSIYLATLGGGLKSLPAVSGAKRLLASLSSQNLQLLTESNQLFTLRTNRWNLIREDVLAITVVY